MRTRIYDQTSRQLRFRLLGIILIVLGPLAIFLAAGLYKVRMTRTAIVEEQAYELARTGADRYQDAIEDIRTVLDLLSHVPEVTRGSPETCSAFLEGIVNSHAWARTFSIATSDNKVHCSTYPGSLGFDMSKREWFQKALSNNAYQVSDFVISSITGVATTFATLRTTDSVTHEPLVIIAGLDLAWFDLLAAGIGEKRHALVMLLDGAGTVVARYPLLNDMRLRTLPTEFFEQATSNKGRAFSAIDPEGRERLFGSIPLAKTNARVVVGFDRSEALRLINLYTMIAGAVFLLTLSLAGYLVWVAGHRIFIRPIEEINETLSAALENMDQGLIMIDADETVSVYNNRALELLDLPPGLMESEPNSDDLRTFLSARGEFSGTPDDIRGFVKPDLSRDAAYVYERIRPNGIVLEIRTTPLWNGGAVRTYKDVTAAKRDERALREREERYRLLADHSTDMIFRLDLDFVRQYVSPACREILGYSPNELTGRKPLNMVHPDDASLVQATYVSVINGLERTSVTNRIRHRDGRWIWVEAEIRLMRDIETGRPTGILGALRDVSARKALEAETAAAREQAENAAKVQAQFLATMSHELRTPLNGIVGFADIVLERSDLAPEVRRQVGLIQTASDALLTVVNDVLDYSKIEEGKLELAQSNFNIANLINDSIALVNGAAVTKHLQLMVSLDERLPAWLIGDDHRLRQVLLNLLNNAIKFTRKGHVSLMIECPSATRDTQEVRFSVSDTGIGISRDKLSCLFQRFSQVDGTTSREFGGSGLGLAISQRLVNAMGGKIEVESTVGKGSSFWFSIHLPIGTAPSLDVNLTSSRLMQNLPTRVLLVEDIDINREIATTVLVRSGYVVDFAVDGSHAVSSVAEKEYDLVLMDIQMPIMDGITATHLIRALPEPRGSIPILAMTANVLPNQVEAFKAAGMNGHVGKPFRRDELVSAIEACLTKLRPPEPAPDNSPATAEVQDIEALETLTALLGPTQIDRLLGKLGHQLNDLMASVTAETLDQTNLPRQAHNIVSSAGMLGFPSLSKLCAQLEVALSSNQDVSNLLSEVRTACVTALQAINMRVGAASADNSASLKIEANR